MFSTAASRSLNLATLSRAVELAVLAVEPFVVDEQAEELFFAQALVVDAREAFFDGIGHAEELHGDELVVSLFE